MKKRQRFLYLGLILVIQIWLIKLGGHTSIMAEEGDLESAVSRAIQDHLTPPQTHSVIVTVINNIDHWAFGILAVPLQEDTHGSPDSYLFLAQQINSKWQVAFEQTPLFQEWVTNSPVTLMGHETKEFFQNMNPAGGGGIAQLSLPYATGESWGFTSGPHNDPRPWDAIDFNGGSGQVRAARDGVAFTPCANFVRVIHPDGWATTYYHLINIAVGNNMPVSRGQFLGDISAAIGCGGSASGAHVHFGLELNGADQDIDGHVIGGWTVHEGASPYAGCLENCSGQMFCASPINPPQIYNDGTIGSCCCGCAGNLLRKLEPDSPEWSLPGQLDGMLTKQLALPSTYQKSQHSQQFMITDIKQIFSQEPSPPVLSWETAVSPSNPSLTYHLYWGNNPNGTGNITQTETNYTPSAVTEPGTYYLRVAVEDEAGQLSAWQTAVTWQYDPTPPTGTLTINNGSETVPALPVTLQLDVDSDVADMRFSADGTSWTEWEAFTPSRRWQLANTEAEQVVYAQVRDRAGNVSEVMVAEVTAVLNPDPPSSASYTVTCSNMSMGGGTVSSNNYTVHHTIGQLHETGTMSNSSYQVRSGFWGACGTSENGTRKIYLPFATR